MKKITVFLLGICFLIYSCEVEEPSISQSSPETIINAEIEATKSNEKTTPEKIAQILTTEADRCEEDIPDYNFWWYDTSIPFLDQFFASPGETDLIYTEYEDGTVNITGTTKGVTKDCEVQVDLWLKDKKTWEEWIAIGGEFKDETDDGACSGAIKEDQTYYVIDGERSFITTSGTKCLGEGTYRLMQRPDPNDQDTPNLGAIIGKGGAIWDNDQDALGLSTWAFITDVDTGERLWSVDFNFVIGAKKVLECTVVEADRCTEDIPDYNFWWYDTSIDFLDQFFSSGEETPLKYIEYSDGTINVTGTTAGATKDCEVQVDLWLKDRKTWAEWEALGGEFKDETDDGACSGAVAENQIYYVIDGERSFITTSGSECLGEGQYRLTQRPDPNDPDAPNFGALIGKGGAIWDNNQDAIGLSTWAYIVNVDSGERLWSVDFNFVIDCGSEIPCGIPQ